MESNLFFILKNFLKKEDFKVNLKELKFQLLSHPSYPSLHSLTGVLSHLGIENLALEVPINVYTLQQTPNNFISLTKDGQFMMVNRVGSNFELLLENKEKKTKDAIDFLKDWSGIVVAAEIDDEKSQLTDKALGNTFSYAIYTFTGLILIGFFIAFAPEWWQLLHFGLAIVGLLISVLIVNNELGFKSKAVDSFCSGGESTSCHDVLNSIGASFFNFLKLSDLSIIYFVGLVISWLLVFSLGKTDSMIALLSLLAMPITLYSIYYQYIVVKKWCPLCLGIITVLWFQFGSLLMSGINFKDISLSFGNTAVALFSFLLAASIWIFIRPLLNGEQALQKLKIEHYKFKRSFDLFLSVLNKGVHLEPHLPTFAAKEIVLGNAYANVNILLVTSPQCFYCKAAHEDLEKVLNKSSDELNLTIRFNVNVKDNEGIGNLVCSRLLELNATEPAETLLKALRDAYTKDSDLKKWLQEWGVPVNHKTYSSILIAQQEWCVENEVHFTPAVFINGKEFPKEYQRTDLIYFIEDLTEQANNVRAGQEDVELVNS